MRASPLIALEGVRKRYGEVEVLRGVSLSVATGQLVAVTGRSGSGKSTLLQLIGGLDRGYSGTIRVAGEELGRLDDRSLAALRATRIGFVFQAFHLLDHLTVRENVRLPGFFAPSPSSAQALLGEEGLRIADEVLARVEMTAFADARPSALSGGQRQRVAIARALFGRPSLLLCDEPTGNLDAQTGEGVIRLFGDLNRGGMTILIVTHEDRVAEAATRIVRIAEGQVVGDEERPS